MSDHDANADELDPDEPHTPWWMPFLGGLLLLVAALMAVATTSGSESDGDGIQPEAADVGTAPATGHRDPHAGHGHGDDHHGHDH